MEFNVFLCRKRLYYQYYSQAADVAAIQCYVNLRICSIAEQWYSGKDIFNQLLTL